MKRKEFIEQVEKLGVKARRVEEMAVFTEVKPQNDAIFTLTINEEMPFDIDSTNCEWLTPEIFALVTEYAATPLEEREEEKKYCVTQVSDVGNTMYIVYWQTGGNYSREAFKENAWTTTSLEKAQALALLVDGEVEVVN